MTVLFQVRDLSEETFEQRPEGHEGGAMQYLGESISGKSSLRGCKGLEVHSRLCLRNSKEEARTAGVE